MKVLDDFKKHSPPKRRVSKLKSFKQEILELYNEGYRVEQIQEYLLTHKVITSRAWLYKFIKQNLNNQNFSLKTPQKNIETQVKTGEKAIFLMQNDNEEPVVPSFQELKQIMQRKHHDIYHNQY